MMISEEALYAAAPEAAEKFLSALPDREDCVHDFSPDFEARMATLLRRQRRRRHWRPCWRRPPCWAPWRRDSPWGRGTGRTARSTGPRQTGNCGTLSAWSTPPPGLSRTPNCAVCRRASSWSAAAPVRSAGERSLAYRRGEDASFTLMQTQGEDLVGSKGTACQGSEVEVNGRLGLLVEEETDSTEKKTCCGRTALHLRPPWEGPVRRRAAGDCQECDLVTGKEGI